MAPANLVTCVHNPRTSCSRVKKTRAAQWARKVGVLSYNSNAPTCVHLYNTTYYVRCWRCQPEEGHRGLLSNQSMKAHTYPKAATSILSTLSIRCVCGVTWFPWSKPCGRACVSICVCVHLCMCVRVHVRAYKCSSVQAYSRALVRKRPLGWKGKGLSYESPVKSCHCLSLLHDVHIAGQDCSCAPYMTRYIHQM